MDVNQESAAGYAMVTDYDLVPTQRTLLILYPLEEGSACDYFAIKIAGNLFYTDKCQFNEKDMDTDRAYPVESAPALQELQRIDLHKLTDIQSAIDASGCEFKNAIKIFVYGTSERNDVVQTIQWKLTDKCYSAEAKKWISELKSVYDKYQ